MSEIDKAARDELRRLRGARPPWTWGGKHEPDSDAFDGYPYVPECSHLGETLIALDGIYEGGEKDCALIEKVDAALPALLDAADEREATRAAIADAIRGDPISGPPAEIVRWLSATKARAVEHALRSNAEARAAAAELDALRQVEAAARNIGGSGCPDPTNAAEDALREALNALDAARAWRDGK